MVPWAKTRNVMSDDPADPAAELNIQNTNQFAAIIGDDVPYSSKEDQVVQRIMSDMLRQFARLQGKSGWVSPGAFAFSGSYPANSFQVAKSLAYVDGLVLTEVGSNLNSETDSRIQLGAPPGSGTRDDLVFLEVFLVEVPGSTPSTASSVNKPDTTHLFKYGNVLFGGTNVTDDINEVNFEIRRRIQVQYRLRVVPSVNFGVNPFGLGDATVLAQGSKENASPSSVPFTAVSSDSGLWVAGNGSVAHQTLFKTVDGRVYAIPLCKVARSAGVTNILSGHVSDLRQIWGGAPSVKSDPVGTCKPYLGKVIPAGYLLCDGTAELRSNYPDLYNAITFTDTGNLTSGSDTLSGLTDTSEMWVGMPVEGTGIPGGTTIDNIIDGTSVSLSANATVTGAQTVRFFPWGNGNGTTTFNRPDGRGRGFIGAGQGSGLTLRKLGQKGGEETHLLTSGESGIPAHTHPQDPSTMRFNTGSGPSTSGTGSWALQGTTQANAVADASQPHNTMQPFLVGKWIVKI